MRYFAIFLELLKKDLDEKNLELKEEKDFFGTYFERILDHHVDISCGSKKIDCNKERGHPETLADTFESSPLCKVITVKSRGGMSPIGQDTIENVS